MRVLSFGPLDLAPHPDPPITRIDLGLVALVVFLWALCFPLIVRGLSVAPPLHFAALRSVIAGAGLLLLALMLRVPLPRGWRVWSGLVGIGLTSTSLGFAGMFMAGRTISPGLATVLANTQPLIAAGLAYFVLEERLGSRRKAGLALGFIGILIIAAPGLDAGNANSSAAGIGYVLSGALGVAVGNVILKSLAGDLNPLMAIGWQFLIGALPLFTASQLLEAPIYIIRDGSFWINLVVLALPGTALAFVLWFHLLRRNNLTRLNAFTFLTPGIALVIGGLAFSERLSLIEAIGVVLTLLGAWLASRTKEMDASTPQLEGLPLDRCSQSTNRDAFF